jgi:hypothetical protein
MKCNDDICTELAGIFRIRLGVKIVAMSRVAGDDKLYTVRCTEPPQAVVAAYDLYNYQNTTRQLKNFLFMIPPTAGSATDGKAPAGFTAGSATDGSATAATATAATATAGSATAGSATALLALLMLGRMLPWLP